MQRLTKQMFRNWRRGIMLAMMSICSAVWAQDSPPRRLKDFESLGYVLMDDVTTPLIHHVETGESYDLLALAKGQADGLVEFPQPSLRSKASSRNEFERAEANPAWSTFVFDRVRALRNARGYLIPLRVNWGEYDFSLHRFPVELRMVKTVWKSSASYHCAGSYRQRSKYEYLTACLTAASLNNKDPFVQFFPISDLTLARQVRESLMGVRVFALAEPEGAYRVLRGAEVRYDAYPAYVATGMQPVRISGLILTDHNSDRVYALAKNPNVSSSPSPATRDERTAGNQDAAVPLRLPPNSWRMLFRDSNTTLYTDAGSAKREGPVVVVREMTDYKAATEDGYRSTVAIYSYNCNMRTAKLMAIKSYTGSMGEGAVVTDSATPRDYGTVDPGTRGEIMFNFACNAAPSNF